jgi:hypothetical protein
MTAVCIALTFAYSAWAQWTVHLNHDVAWVLYSAGRILEGDRFGLDVLAANPPLAWYWSLPAALLAKASGLAPWTALHLWTWAVLISAILAMAIVLRPLREAGRDLESNALLLAAAFVVALLPAREFAQREHLAMALCLPYLASLGIRYELSAVPLRLVAVACGVLGGIAFAFKPYFLLVPLLASVLLVVKSRRIRDLLCAENLAMGATIAAYVGTIPLLAPEYLSTAVPLFRGFYWGFQNVGPDVLLQRLSPAGAIVAVSLLLMLLAWRLTGFHAMLLAAVVGFAVAYLLQLKGYAYQHLPVLGFAYILFTYSLAVLVTRASAWFPKLNARGVGLLLVLLGTWQVAADTVEQCLSWRRSFDRHSGDVGMLRSRLVSAVDELTEADETVYALSTHPFPGFPTVLYANSTWVGRSNSLVAVPALVKARTGEAPVGFDVVRVDGFQRNEVTHALQRRPRVVLVDRSGFKHGIGRRPFDAVEYFSSDVAFATEWSHYREIQPIANTRIFVRGFE